MKQIIQSFKTGETTLEDVPVPGVKRGTVLIRTTRSLVSLGTERMLVEFGKANLFTKARQQPDKVKQVLDKVKTDGLVPTIQSVLNKLSEPMPLGYCNVGEVIAVGEGVSDFKIGDRVASNGHHAEFVCVPVNLVAHIPDNVSDEEAAFTVVGSIALQGIRLANPSFGETVVVIGMGLIGLLSSQLLIANGCNVIGVDIDDEKLCLAKSWGVIPFNAGIEDVVKFVQNNTNGTGADAVLITASSKADEIISQAARMSRKRGRIILVGVVGLNLRRAEFYEKELTFQVSCSYGPGRYDANYEQLGIDYPLPFVRWTEKRNFEAVLHALASGKLCVNKMISEIVPIHEFQRVYGQIATKRSIASILQYPAEELARPSATLMLSSRDFSGSTGVLGVIGAGNFTKMILLPALKRTSAACKYIASAGGLSSTMLAKKFGFSHSTTDLNQIFSDENVDLVLITTRHDTHASLAAKALYSGKHVFVEKPLAITKEQLNLVIDAYDQSKASLTVGFNRRFSPHAKKVKSLLGMGPMNVIATINAGYISAELWLHDMNVGGGRIIGEACHFMDLITFFTGSKIVAVCMNAMGVEPASNTDNASICLKYQDGSTGIINYFSNGAKSYPKERVEVYWQQRVAVIDNFRTTTGFGFKNFSKLKTQLDKGHKNQFSELVTLVKSGGEPLIPFEEIINTTRASFAAIESLRQNSWIEP